MKKGFLKKFLLCALTAFPAWGMLSAQTVKEARLGYTSDKVGRGLIAQTDQTAEYHAAVLLSHEVLHKYVGSKITKIEFGMASDIEGMMQVMIWRNLNDKPIRMQATPGKKGWNTVKLTTPYNIKAGDELYIGYLFQTTPNTLSIQGMTCDDEEGKTPGVNWYGVNGRWNLFDTPQIPYDFAIRAYVEGENLPTNDVQISQLNSADIIMQGSNTEAEFTLRNFGLDMVEDVTIDLIANGEVFDTKLVEGVFMEHNTETKVLVDQISFPNEGNNTLEVKVTKVNGKEDTDLSDNKVTHKLFAAKAGTTPYPRNVLFEQFTTESRYNSVQADSTYTSVAGGKNNVIWIKHHMDDQFELAKTAPYAHFFDNSLPFNPAVMVDRNIFWGYEEYGPAYFVPAAEYAASLIEKSFYFPAFVAPQVLVYDNNDGKLQIEVSATTTTNALPFQQDPRVVVYVVEDQVKSNKQAFPHPSKPNATVEGEYTHDGIIRAVATESCWGDPINVSSYSFKKSYSVDLDPSWNKDNIRVVAAVTNYDTYSKDLLQVYNAASNTIQGTLGIGCVTNVNNEKPQVNVIDGHIQLSEGHKILGIYDLSGKMANNSRLVPGIYVVRTTNGTATYNTKVVVK